MPGNAVVNVLCAVVEDLETSDALEKVSLRWKAVTSYAVCWKMNQKS